MPIQPPEALVPGIILIAACLYAINKYAPRRVRSWIRRTFRLDP